MDGFSWLIASHCVSRDEIAKSGQYSVAGVWELSWALHGDVQETGEHASWWSSLAHDPLWVASSTAAASPCEGLH